MTATVDKVVCYVIHDARLLVFTHDNEPLTVTGVQVPAGTVETGEPLDAAARRELLEETGLCATASTFLGTAPYDLRPTRDEIAVRHFFLLEVAELPSHDRWNAAEPDPSGGGGLVPWTCWWLSLEDAHVLAAGFGAFIGTALDHLSARK